MLHINEAIVTKVYDGDTITVDLDLGYGIWKKKESIRLMDIDTPEIRSEHKEIAIAARDYLSSIVIGKKVLVDSRKKDKYGRYLAYIYLSEEMYKLGQAVNDLMVNSEHARRYYGGTREEW